MSKMNQLYATVLKAGLTTALFVAAPVAGYAASIVAAEYEFGGGNDDVPISSGSRRANLISPTIGGTLETYSFWVNEASTAFTTSANFPLQFRMDFRRDDPGGVLYETSLATVQFTQSNFTNLTPRTIANGMTFLRKDWDLSTFDLDIEAGDVLSVSFRSNPRLDLPINNADAPGALPQPATQNLALTSFVTTLQTEPQSLIYQLTVNDGGVSAVPVPPMLPAMVMALFGLGAIRRWRQRA